jgi:hypothetical protein
MSDPAARWKECDADGKGMVLFDEFSAWAIQKSLDLEDDDNNDEEIEEPKINTRKAENQKVA